MEQQLTIPRYEVDIFWSDADDAFVAVVPDLPYCSAWGDTYEEALSQVQSAILGHVKVAQKYGDPIPEPRSPREIDGSGPVQQTEAVDWAAPTDPPQDASFSYDAILRNLGDQQRAFQDLARQSADAYAYFLGSALWFYQQALQQATQVARSNVQAGQVGQSGMQAVGQAAHMQAVGQAAQSATQAATQAAQQSTQSANQAAQESANAAGQAAQKSAGAVRGNSSK